MKRCPHGNLVGVNGISRGTLQAIESMGEKICYRCDWE